MSAAYQNGHGPDDWTPNEPAEHVTRLGSGSVPAHTIPEMRPVMTHAKYLENRTRTKPPSPFSLHIENRR